MSLISEALRKAQLEALQQDREQRRFYMTHGGRPVHAPAGMSRTSLAIGILGALCVLSAGALLYLTLDRSRLAPPAITADAARTATRPAVPLATTSSAPAVHARGEVPATEPASRKAAQRTTKAPAAPARSRAKTDDPPVAGAAVSETPRSSARRIERDGFRDGETYGSPVLGPFGTEVVLTGITALRGQRMAIINGNTVRAGTAVGPFVVEEIESRRVRLKYVDVTFYLVQ